MPQAAEPTEAHPLIPRFLAALQALSLHAGLCHSFPSPTNKALVCAVLVPEGSQVAATPSTKNSCWRSYCFLTPFHSIDSYT